MHMQKPKSLPSVSVRSAGCVTAFMVPRGADGLRRQSQRESGQNVEVTEDAGQAVAERLRRRYPRSRGCPDRWSSSSWESVWRSRCRGWW